MYLPIWSVMLMKRWENIESCRCKKKNQWSLYKALSIIQNLYIKQISTCLVWEEHVLNFVNLKLAAHSLVWHLDLWKLVFSLCFYQSTRHLVPLTWDNMRQKKFAIKLNTKQRSEILFESQLTSILISPDVVIYAVHCGSTRIVLWIS